MTRLGRRFAAVGLVLVTVAGCGSRRSEDALRAPLRRALPEPSMPSEVGRAADLPAVRELPAPAAGPAPSAGGEGRPAIAGPAPSVAGPAPTGKPTAGALPAPSKTAAAPSETQRKARGPATSGAETPPAPAPAPGDAGAQSSAPLRIGMNGTLSGPLGAVFRGGIKAVQTWVADVNSRGGLHGHRVELYMADDGGDPARNRANAQRLVDQDKVVAMVFENSIAGAASVSYYQQKRIPVIGSVACLAWVSRNPLYFPQVSSDPLCAEANARGIAGVAVPQNKRKLALVVCVEAEGCENMTRDSAYQAAGFEVVYKAKVSLAQPDFTAQCLGARNAGAEVLSPAVDTPSVSRLADSCASVGYRPLFGFPSLITTDEHLKKHNLEGHVVVYLTAPPFQTGNPGIAAVRSAMATHAPGVAVDGAAVLGWSSGKLLERAAQNLTTPSSEAILEGLWSIRDDDLGGITAPLTFQRDSKNNGAAMKLCYWLVQSQNGRWTEPNGGQRRCEPWNTQLLGG